ncbi:MAG TPA: zinc metallopeptidase [Chloroflexia bacterium]|jgi:Zn-dependent membrane protease YugP|nr:zinc metallopeptidase [Chloroflexia bacterium]
MIFDPRYLLFVMLPTMALAFFAQWWVKSAFQQASQIPNNRRLTGAQAARQILDSAGLVTVPIQPTQTAAMRQGSGSSPALDDHYDPSDKTLYLSGAVFGSASIASVAVAAHEAGHAIQDAQGYAPMRWRSALVPAANIGSNLGIFIVIIGLVLGITQLSWLGVAAFGLGVLFALMTLPVELNASSRALQLLTTTGVVDQSEMGQARSVLRAAAFTYVAGLAAAVLNLLYWISIVSGSGGRRR